MIAHAETTPKAHGRSGYRSEVRARRKSFGDFCQHVANVGGLPVSQAVVNKSATALAEFTGASGGYLCPPELKVGIDQELTETELFHQHAYRQPMTSNELWVPAFDITAAHATGASPLFGGLNPVWTTLEGNALTESEPKFSGGMLKVRELECYAVASNQLVDDGGEALGTYLEHKFTEALRWAVNRACFQGDGEEAPLGIINAGATKTVTRSGNGAIAQSDVANMVGALIPACFKRAIWACSLSAFAKISNISTYFANFPAQDNDGVTGVGGYLLSRPLYVTENLPVVGTTGDLILFDPSLYVLGERHIEVAASRHVNFNVNQTVFRLWWRGDGMPLVLGNATLADGSTSAGAFVALHS